MGSVDGRGIVMEFPADSFPCLVCDKTLRRAFQDYEAQPNDGVLCSTNGNYGSTIFDPMDGSELVFNICDDCLVKAGEQGRIMATRSRVHVTTDYLGVVGWEAVDRPYIPWHKDLPDDGDSKGRHYDLEELEKYQDRLHLRFTIEQMREWIEAEDKRRGVE